MLEGSGEVVIRDARGGTSRVDVFAGKGSHDEGPYMQGLCITVGEIVIMKRRCLEVTINMEWMLEVVKGGKVASQPARPSRTRSLIMIS